MDEIGGVDKAEDVPESPSYPGLTLLGLDGIELRVERDDVMLLTFLAEAGMTASTRSLCFGVLYALKGLIWRIDCTGLVAAAVLIRAALASEVALASVIAFAAGDSTGLAASTAFIVFHSIHLANCFTDVDLPKWLHRSMPSGRSSSSASSLDLLGTPMPHTSRPEAQPRGGLEASSTARGLSA